MSEASRFHLQQDGAETRAPRAGWLRQGLRWSGRAAQPASSASASESPAASGWDPGVFPEGHGEGLRPAGEACEGLLLSLACGGGSVKVEGGSSSQKEGENPGCHFRRSFYISSMGVIHSFNLFPAF